MNHPHRWVRAVLAVLALGLSAASTLTSASVAGADDAHQDRDLRITPMTHKVDGRTADQLLGDVFVKTYTLPVAENPYGAGSPCVSVGRHGEVLWRALTGPATCTVERGTPVFLAFGAACSDVEPPPFFSPDETGQRACARGLLEGVASILVTVDGGRTVNVRNSRFDVRSTQRNVMIPEDNILGAGPGPGTLTAHGWAGVIRGLPIGEHTITGAVTFDDGTPPSPPFTFEGWVVNVIANDDRD